MREIDYTKHRLNSKPYGRPIRKCPGCGRKGEFIHYVCGDDGYSHKARVTIGVEVYDHCYIKAQTLVVESQ